MKKLTAVHLFERIKSPQNRKQLSTILIFLSLSLIIFLLSDIFKINNPSDKWLFLTDSNIKNVLNQISMNAIIAFGMTLVILVNGIDLSVGSIVAVGGVLLSWLFIDFGLPLLLAYVLVLIFGAIIGSVNGVLITKFSLPPFIVTLATMIIFRGIAFIISDGKAKFTADPAFKIIGNSFIGFFPISVIIMLVGFFLVHMLLVRTTIGRKMYILGGNEEAAVFSGIHVGRIRIIAYAIVGFLSSLSGILLSSRLGSGSPNVGVQYELDAIAAVVIGGTSFSGGIGTIIGTLIGALILGIINNGMNLMGITPFLQYVVKGLIIVGAVILDKMSDK